MNAINTDTMAWNTPPAAFIALALIAALNCAEAAVIFDMQRTGDIEHVSDDSIDDCIAAEFYMYIGVCDGCGACDDSECVCLSPWASKGGWA